MKQFNNAWKEASKSIFRLELLTTYNVPGDLECFQRFLRGEEYINDEFKEWFNELKVANEKGIKTERVRVYELPLNDYIKYEIDVWKYSDKAGDKISFLDFKKYTKIIKDLQITSEDFWLFDDYTLIIFHYDSSGTFIYEEEINNLELIKKYIALKYQLLKNSTPYKEFTKSL